MRRIILAIGLATALASAGGSAWARGPSGAAPVATPAANDERIVTEAYTAFQAGGYPALAPRLDTLRSLLDRAPGGSRSESYPLAALMLGAYAVEYRQYEEAVRILDRGLAFQPDSVAILMERGQALLALRRPADALGSFEAALSSSQMDARSTRSRALRSRGVALIDLQRLDDAERALNASLELDPGNAATREELRYIAELRAGGPTRPTEVQPNDRSSRPGERAT